jgi:hypothetical protein
VRRRPHLSTTVTLVEAAWGRETGEEARSEAEASGSGVSTPKPLLSTEASEAAQPPHR